MDVMEILRRLCGVGIWAGAVWVIIQLETESLSFQTAFDSAMSGNPLGFLVIVGWIVTALLLHRTVNRIFRKAGGNKSRSTYKDGFKID